MIAWYWAFALGILAVPVAVWLAFMIWILRGGRGGWGP